MQRSIFIVFMLIFSIALYCQDQTTENEKLDDTSSQTHSESVTSAEQTQGFLFITAGPQALYNAEGLNTAPSPISFSMGLGGKISFLKNYLSFSPYIKGWASYYILYNGKAVPGTMEKRTSYTLHALIDIPIFVHLPVKKSIFSLGLGVSILARLGFAVSVLPEDEKEDIATMNAYYWGNGRFFYPCLILSWDYLMEDGTSLGFEARAHYPVSSASDDVPSPIQNGLLSVSGRFFFPQKW